MKLFQCQSCGNAVHFDNTTCIVCGHRLGYLPDRFTLSAVEADGDHWRALADPTRGFFFCDNAVWDACNWLVPTDAGSTLCLACRHNRLVPDLSVPDHLAAWQKIEQAEHHLFYSLTRWRLPIPDRSDDPIGGLVFDALAEVPEADGTVAPVITGHDNGEITLAITEADDATREARRSAMGEPYRTLLGHFRHEIGHFYWNRLVRDGGPIDRCRTLFGDERQDYAEALRRHYDTGAPSDWRSRFISAYASAHPWEDFAETWAHYMHMVDALETARAFGLVVKPPMRHDETLEAEVDFDPYGAGSVDDLVAAWVPVTVALNSINRSMGQPDFYPFVLPEAVVAKLRFIHDLVRAAGVVRA